ncbi:LysR family transcriptional regulator [Bradyrhizobium guangzhouense]|uniref:LysR family transcriptional regulator n=1 Tax=Bradyrhizobium guangzhouense TaxID=1325095 RepID=A0AAE5WX54_9BRAD|nr:LysR family transcriptional regulator [Bradyrhizobium guangzhouense]QAU44760.1 LysR family transcriptional regulator [Bradyrhizobium guangzhouense]RXH05062.1 LysR family transcriptional regulator [Bradyrhizobium guangzhouense]
MAKKLADWDARIGRRIRLRDLHVLSSVVKFGSMAKAATQLGLTQPAISQAIADLEAALGVRLLDRGPRGVSPTAFGEAMLLRGTEAFDALRQGVRDIEFMSDPGTGEIWVGASESFISGGLLAAVTAELAIRYPKLVVHVIDANTAAMEFRELHDRKVDLMLGRIGGPIEDDDLAVETLYEEAIVAGAGTNHPLAGRRKLALADLVAESWILAPPSTAVRELVHTAFTAQGLPPPSRTVTTYSMQLRMQLLATGRYLSSVPESLVRYNAKRWSLVALPVVLGRPLPVVLVTLKARTLSPAVEVFITQMRALARRMRGRPGAAG